MQQPADEPASDGKPALMAELTPKDIVTFGAPMLPDPARLKGLVDQVLASGWLSNGGPLHLQLEQALAEHQLAGDVVALTSSGTMALMLALGLGNLPTGAEVITTPLTFAATAQAIAWSGLTPVFADVDPITLNLCPQAVKAAITPRTAAILPVHFLGVPCDVSSLADIARSQGLWLVYDAAHAFGVTVQDQPIGHFGDCSAFSLHATKVLNTGEGGFVVTRSEHARELRRLRNFGLDQGVPATRGLNGKMSELHAAMGLALLPDLPAEIEARKALRHTFDTELDGVPGLHIHRAPTGSSASLGYYALRLAPSSRAALHVLLAENGILARDHFPLLCGPDTFWRGSVIVTKDGSAPVAPEVGPEILCLPLHGRVGPQVAATVGNLARTLLQRGEQP